MISLKDLIKQNNVYVEYLIKDSMILAVSDRGIDIPVVFRQAEDKVSYAISF